MRWRLVGTIGEYTSSGATVTNALITGSNTPSGIAVSGSNPFVANYNGTIGEYTTSGATVNASLITLPGFSSFDIAVVPVPEPSTFLLVATRVAGLAVRRRHARGASFGGR